MTRAQRPRKKRAARASTVSVTAYNNQRDWRPPLKRLQAAWQRAASLILLEQHPLPTRIYIQLIDAPTMRRLHKTYLQDPTDTDVLTFHHGEVFICPYVARRQAKAFSKPILHEVMLYGIHGLLHLAGWDDATSRQFAAMQKKQEALLLSVLKLGKK